MRINKPRIANKKRLTLFIILTCVVFFIFIHTSPVRVAKNYFFWHSYCGASMLKPVEVEYRNNNLDASVYLQYKDNFEHYRSSNARASLGTYKSKFGLWFVTPNSVCE